MNTLQRTALIVGSLLMATLLFNALTDWTRSPDERYRDIGTHHWNVAPGQLVVIALVLAATTTGVYFACAGGKK